MITIALVWSCRVVSFLNSTTWTRRLCPRLDQTQGQHLYMSRLNEQVYDQTKSADLSETPANPTGLCGRPGRRPWSQTQSGRVALVEFGYTGVVTYTLYHWHVLCCGDVGKVVHTRVPLSLAV